MAKRLLLILMLFVIGDAYFFQAFTTVIHAPFLHKIYWYLDVLLLIGVFTLIFLRQQGKDIQRLAGDLVTSFLIVFIPKLPAFPILLAEDLVRLLQGFPPRSIYISEFVLTLALLIVLIIVFGLTRGRHLYRVREEVLSFPDLPDAFDGFKITQISDIHSGSLSDVNGVRKGIELANAQDSDLLLFTGDLVNNKAAEMESWISDFTSLKAPFGKFSVLGNHDYGDYTQWDSAELKASNLIRLKEIHQEMGFKLLMNESITIQKKGARIALIGVENWGKGGFHQYGDLSKATSGLPVDSFNILMSHDPSHWDHVTLDHEKHVHLTLAGHTHGMQFGIELFGFKWSPIQYFYEQWAGLYQKQGKYLYVNRGFGYHGLKGRIGVWPEITVITLKKSIS
ncbi:metallophosphoesterase [Sphingobacterium sp. BIGb0165]|uniref:metallophosphoesterase n=1 Tax=Sphingobacterium sp. BIGb0165 TaxID=2940615 RepID=UPI0021694F6E|nr:metallophosphoesterase [Sphingobacterium sp. BIGb0165]MCS4226196.1 putative MPP superfamily phosphohydrolase [Sphingobacterium sp. BIGb0165]